LHSIRSEVSPARILRLNPAGFPLSWLTKQEAARLWVKDQVLWVLGDHDFVIRGGTNRAGQQSVLRLPPILASAGSVRAQQQVTPLVSNRLLFRRDRNLCLYCGEKFPDLSLTRDHVVARCRGGRDTWMNLVTACRRCNQRKGARTPEEAGMPLLAVPFVPNQMELLALSNRHILADQMAYLENGFSSNMSRLPSNN
jgi:5-methylcytosine-specific restriction endonuclease McrA